ncbi:glycosyl transferase family 28 [Micromonospora arborensis]|uniref:Glycosyl transferase family 28 n=1 Tax=Micromonospora arborensis TaxID=2116518 RepID=A0A318NBS6_9ACTN|nr:activator-dependent family glycosyltransferase [Micromonospora arborensis]PYC63451.1 glycosyl transferase family 28 [Micromonospora arborensis]
MRVLATVFATKPHLFNLVPVLAALRAAGHEVWIASHPDLMDTIERIGFTGVPVGNELNMMASLQAQDGADRGASNWESLTSGMTETREERLTWNYVLGAFTMGCSADYDYVTDQAMLDELVELAREWQPHLVIWDALTFAGAIAAHASGAAHARMLFGIDYISRMYDRYLGLMAEQPVGRRDDPVTDWISGRLARAGCTGTPGPDLVREMMTGQVTIDPTPGWMQLPLTVPRLPVRYVPFNGPSTIPDWVHETPSRPRVCLSLGVSGQLLGGDFVSVVDLVTALAELDVEVVATLNADQLAAVDALPDNVRAVDFVPLNDLLPTCAAIVQHGGFGTLGNVLVHGVPSLTVPAPWWDERDLGRKLHERRAGIHLEPGDVTPHRLTEAVASLLGDPVYRERAAAVRAEILATPPPGELTRALEDLASERMGLTR